MQLFLSAAIFAFAFTASASAAVARRDSNPPFDCNILKAGTEHTGDSFKGLNNQGKPSAFVFYGFGRQEYKCKSGKFVLQQPFADLYLDINKKSGIVGSHGFESIEGNPFWESGHTACGKVVTQVNSKMAGESSADVPWLRSDALDAGSIKTSELANIKQVIRVDTHGGAAPATCTKEGEATTVSYSAKYVLYN